jgi:DeoR/GlpR family transcriptional regulator of sugar metabolism
MLKTERQEKIMQILEENNTMRVSALADALNSSMMTIRRDLDDLEQENKVRKVHGGVLIVKPDNNQPSFSERIEEFTKEKIRIAKAAVKHIEEGSVVFFDSGTTTLHVAKCLSNDISFTAITNGLMTATELSKKPYINVIMLGGEIHHSSFSAVNNIAIEQAARFNADLALISTKALSIPEGLFEPLLPLIEIKKSLVSASKKVVLLADYSKFESKALCLSIPLSEIDEIITDSRIPGDTVRELEDLDIKVTVV